MNVVLVHPIHGAKVAINADEMAEDLRNGWSEYNPTTPVEAEPEPEPKLEPKPQPEAEAPKRKYTRRATQKPVEQPNEVPSFLTSASDESEGK